MLKEVLGYSIFNTKPVFFFHNYALCWIKGEIKLLLRQICSWRTIFFFFFCGLEASGRLRRTTNEVIIWIARLHCSSVFSPNRRDCIFVDLGEKYLRVGTNRFSPFFSLVNQTSKSDVFSLLFSPLFCILLIITPTKHNLNLVAYSFFTSFNN